ncbi:uncharacterized, partial [Tachysurus ichikawai]
CVFKPSSFYWSLISSPVTSLELTGISIG